MLLPRVPTSADVLKQLLEGAVPAVPPVGMNWCDVRDVADVHVEARRAPRGRRVVRADSRSPQRQLSPISTQALTHPDAVGRRYIVDSGSMLFTEIADEMRARFPEWRVPKWRAPWALVYLASFIDPQERANVAAALQAVAPG